MVGTVLLVYFGNKGRGRSPTLVCVARGFIPNECDELGVLHSGIGNKVHMACNHSVLNLHLGRGLEVRK
jgi:hypothetical protein